MSVIIFLTREDHIHAFPSISERAEYFSNQLFAKSGKNRKDDSLLERILPSVPLLAHVAWVTPKNRCVDKGINRTVELVR